MATNLKNMTLDEKYDLAEEPNTAVDILRELSRDGGMEVRMSVAVNPNTPVGVLRDLSQDEDSDVRGHVAMNPNTPGDILRQLTWAGNFCRSQVASNSNIPDNLLRELAKDSDEWIRRRAVLNTKATRKLVVTMFEYEKNLKIPSTHVIKALYESEKLPYVAKVIIETLFGERL